VSVLVDAVVVGPLPVRTEAIESCRRGIDEECAKRSTGGVRLVQVIGLVSMSAARFDLRHRNESQSPYGSQNTVMVSCYVVRLCLKGTIQD
jgi:hypothetical protein